MIKHHPELDLAISNLPEKYQEIIKMKRNSKYQFKNETINQNIELTKECNQYNLSSDSNSLHKPNKKSISTFKLNNDIKCDLDSSGSYEPTKDKEFNSKRRHKGSKSTIISKSQNIQAKISDHKKSFKLNEIAYIKENPLKKSELDLHLPTSLIKEDFKIASLSEITMKTISINNKGNGLIFPDIKSRHR